MAAWAAKSRTSEAPWPLDLRENGYGCSITGPEAQGGGGKVRGHPPPVCRKRPRKRMCGHAQARPARILCSEGWITIRRVMIQITTKFMYKGKYTKNI